MTPILNRSCTAGSGRTGRWPRRHPRTARSRSSTARTNPPPRRCRRPPRRTAHPACRPSPSRRSRRRRDCTPGRSRDMTPGWPASARRTGWWGPRCGCRCGPGAGRRSCCGRSGSGARCSGSRAWHRRSSRRDTRAGHFYNSVLPNEFAYSVQRQIPKGVFCQSYPSHPSTFGEHLCKARMDARLQIKELAEALGVTPDSIINWEIRGVRPAPRNIPHLAKAFPDIVTRLSA